MTDGQLGATILGFVAPLALAWFKRWNLNKNAQAGIILAGLLVVAGVTMLLSGDINPAACSGLDLLPCVKIVVGYLVAVFGAALGSYKYVWQAFGIDDRIAGK
jgi:hypothetical protein